MNRSFWSLVVTQFLGAFNDNAFRGFMLALALGISAEATPWLPLDDKQSVIMGLFAAPFVLFALLGGSLADRFSKRTVCVVMKWAEVLVMALGMGAFAIHALGPDDVSGADNMYLQVSVACTMVVLFLMGTQSAFFGPAKYGIIPELVEERQLTRANSIISMTTQLAIVLGVAMAGVLLTFLSESKLHYFNAGYFFVGLGLLGTLASYGIRKLPAADPERPPAWNFVTHLGKEYKLVAKDRQLLLAILAGGWWWMIGSLAMPAINIYGLIELELLPAQLPPLMIPLALGIGVGSLLAALLSGRSSAELGLVPIGALGMAGSFAALFFMEPSMLVLRGALISAGVFGGLYLVPLSAFTQQRPGKADKGRVMGVIEQSNFIFIFLSAGVYMLLSNVMSLDPQQIFLVTAFLMLIGAGVIFSLTPHYLTRLVLWVLTHTLYRIKILHPERVPTQGGALLVSNHVSFVDPFLVGSVVPRFVRYIMHREFTRVPFVGRFTRMMKVIPISESDGPRQIVQSLQVAVEHARAGRLVCVFAEGGITRTGNMLPFMKGLERIAKKADVPIIPMFIDRMWGSIFSFRGGRFFFKRPEHLPHPVTIAIGEALPPNTPTWKVRQAVQELSAEAVSARKKHGETLATRFLRKARRYPRRLAMVDHTKTEVTYRKALIGAILTRNLLKKHVQGQKHVGIMLPTSNGGSIANLGTTLLGKISVNLNYTAGPESLQSTIDQCELKTIITSTEFLEKLGIPSDESHLDFKELMSGATTGDRLRAALTAMLPSSILTRLAGVPRDPDQVATVIFSSGSTGAPKGICLTHQNVLANAGSFSQVFRVDKTDRMIGVLPFFHSFGYTATIWFPLLAGFTVVYHFNPTDGKAIADLMRNYKGTIILSTPTFYQSYLRRLKPEDTTHLRIAASGAEKLKPALAKLWEERYGTPIYEGYGCTELSPGVSINVPNYDVEPNIQTGYKPGTIGHPLPGVAVRVVDPDTFEERAVNEEGLLLVKGASVMQGYLKRPDLTEDAIRDGWYVTGDIARVDDDGFITITDRMSRFSKIGGEMVPHVKIESEIQTVVIEFQKDSASGEFDGECGEVAVTSIPDDRKGEKLVVLHTPLEFEVDQVIAKLKDEGSLPNLWIPRKDCFVEVPEIPKLGSGKLDLKSIKSIAVDTVT